MIVWETIVQQFSSSPEEQLLSPMEKREVVGDEERARRKNARLRHKRHEEKLKKPLDMDKYVQYISKKGKYYAIQQMVNGEHTYLYCGYDLEKATTAAKEIREKWKNKA